MKLSLTRPHRFARCPRRPAGFTLGELIVLVAIFAIALSLTLPSLARGRVISGVNVSLNNLFTLGVTQVVYAADFTGRQMTLIDEDISSYGSSITGAFTAYTHEVGIHPSIILGWGENEEGVSGVWRLPLEPGFSGNYRFAMPIDFEPESLHVQGSYRFHNWPRVTYPYVGGRFYDAVFYPPNDPFPRMVAEPAFDEPWEWVFVEGATGPGAAPAWSSYCMSPAAMYHPDVLRAPPDGGWQDPWSIDHAFQSPGLFQAAYPSLKTSMIERHWNQNPPAYVCNPAFVPGTYGGCEPYYFNHGLASAPPATLFFDLSVRLLSNEEAMSADASVMGKTGYGLWSRDTPYGADGFLGQYGFDDIRVSHHILTTDGILGRDTIAMPSPVTR